jgi:hypothetical protein
VLARKPERHALDAWDNPVGHLVGPRILDVGVRAEDCDTTSARPIHQPPEEFHLDLLMLLLDLPIVLGLHEVFVGQLLGTGAPLEEMKHGTQEALVLKKSTRAFDNPSVRLLIIVFFMFNPFLAVQPLKVLSIAAQFARALEAATATAVWFDEAISAVIVGHKQEL